MSILATRHSIANKAVANIRFSGVCFMTSPRSSSTDARDAVFPEVLLEGPWQGFAMMFQAIYAIRATWT